MNKFEKRAILIVILAIFGIILVISGIILACVLHNSNVPEERRAYKQIQSGDYGDALMTVYSDNSPDGRALYNYAFFLRENGEDLDLIEAEEVAAGIPYYDIYRDAEKYLTPSTSSKYYGEINTLYQHAVAVYAAASESYLPEEAALYEGNLPQEGMNVKYLKVTSIGEADSIKESSRDEGYDYNWHSNGTQIFYAYVVDDYVISVTDYSYHLTDENDSENNSGSYNAGNHSSSNSSYDDGYDDVWDNDDYDYDRYDSDPDYADGVDDAMDEDDEGW